MESIYCDTLKYRRDAQDEVLSRELRGEHNVTWAAYIDCVSFGICCQVSHGGGLSPPRSLKGNLEACSGAALRNLLPERWESRV